MRIGLIGTGRIGAFHAATLAALPAVDRLVLHDAVEQQARELAGKLGADWTGDLDALLGSGLDGVVIAAPTAVHDTLIRAAVAAGVPVFCEKPVAAGLEATRALLAATAGSGVPLQVGFQRRFDAGYTALRDAAAAGELGWLHTVRACTADPAPPPAGYLPLSGGIFRDCAVHDFDSVRWVTGREVVEVSATGANRGDGSFAAAGDVDTAVAVLTLDDGTLVSCTATRYNGAGYDARMELAGSRATLATGYGDRAPLRTTADGTPSGTAPYDGFLSRFHDAYVAEMAAFTEVAACLRPSPCTGADALAALLIAEAADRSRRTGRPVRVGE
ncbi:Gfo/Idh/MocA family oxidoreductase [Streptomyces sp. NPDC057521]|uniref:Gfo/Idh/MocA family protein n=1 Tax=Streptomyces sp. NPDC057521 TaxID=3346156 RepID=UPI0036BB3424